MQITVVFDDGSCTPLFPGGLTVDLAMITTSQPVQIEDYGGRCYLYLDHFEDKCQFNAQYKELTVLGR